MNDKKNYPLHRNQCSKRQAGKHNKPHAHIYKLQDVTKTQAKTRTTKYFLFSVRSGDYSTLHFIPKLKKKKAL